MMAVGMQIARAFLSLGLALAALPALGADSSEDMRLSARILAAQETPVAKRDLKGFCNATYASADYASYAAGMCQLWVKNNGRQAEECSETKLEQGIRKDIERCLA
ncbi:MAG: hypothetical protein EXR29_07200, partial [Betaproteobacteria bacterium]|nr:hypothetical protein [Betaproteobacteria bacterium]